LTWKELHDKMPLERHGCRSSEPAEVLVIFMPLGIVSEEEFLIETRLIEHGRGNGIKNVSEPLRALIAQESIAGASAKELSKTFGISESSISAYKNGAHSTATYHKPDAKLEAANDEVRSKISGVAFNKLMDAMNCITKEKLLDAGVRTAASVARDMSQVAKNMTGTEDGVNIKNSVVIYRPRMREEESYDVIDVQEIER